MLLLMKNKHEKVRKDKKFLLWFNLPQFLEVNFKISRNFYLNVSHFSFAMSSTTGMRTWSKECMNTHRNKVASWVCCSNHCRWVAKHFAMSACRYEVCENNDKSQNHFDAKSFPCWYSWRMRYCGLEISLIARKWNSVIEMKNNNK